MHRIVDAAKGVTTTDLSVAFQIRTRYRCYDGLRLHMTVGLGMNVSVNFIVSNAWMKGINAVIDYGAAKIRVPLQDDIQKFPMVLRPPTKSVPLVNDRNRNNRKAAFMALPNIEGLVAVMTAFNPKSP